MTMIHWMETHSAMLLTGLGVLGLVTFVTSLIALPIIVARLPVDHFIVSCRRMSPWRSCRPVRNTLLAVLRNLLGTALVIGGVMMLVLPGQGILTIVIGLLMIDLPKKRAFQARLLAWKPVNRGINWMRRRAHQPEFVLQSASISSTSKTRVARGGMVRPFPLGP